MPASHALLVDSRRRDPSESAAGYVVRLDDALRNVESVELVHAVYPRVAASPELMVNLSIDELNARVYSNSDAVTDSFTQLPMVDAGGGGVVVYNGGGTHYRSRRAFRVPLERLTRLTLRFTDLEGKPFPMPEHQLRFVVVTSDRSAAMDTGYVERLAEPGGRGAALLGLGAVYSEGELRAAYARKCQMYLAEQRSGAELERLTAVYERLIARFV